MSANNTNSKNATNSELQADMLKKIADFCHHAKNEIGRLGEQFNTMRAFHEEQLKIGAELKAGAIGAVGGRDRNKALENLNKLAEALDKAKQDFTNMLAELPQVQANKAIGLGVSQASTEADDAAEDDTK